MANMRAIRTRIKSLESTRQITRSMKLVAASKLRRTQAAYTRLEPFAKRCYGTLLEVLSSVGEGGGEPLLASRLERRRVCYVTFVGNRGLCGAYNQTLVRFVAEQAQRDGREAFLVVCGAWGGDAFANAGLRVERRFELSDTPSAEEARELADCLKGLYLSGQADEVVLAYQQYRSVLVQAPGLRRLFPAAAEDRGPAREYIFEPDKGELVAAALELYINTAVYAAMLEAKTSEHSARMTAMTAASDNAEGLASRLRLELNHLRQSAITTEISEISGGAAVMDRDRH